jgi:hypothetical protein
LFLLYCCYWRWRGGEGHVAFFVRFLLLNQNQGTHMYSILIF